MEGLGWYLKSKGAQIGNDTSHIYSFMHTYTPDIEVYGRLMLHATTLSCCHLTNRIYEVVIMCKYELHINSACMQLWLIIIPLTRSPRYFLVACFLDIASSELYSCCSIIMNPILSSCNCTMARTPVERSLIQIPHQCEQSWSFACCLAQTEVVK